MKNKLPNLTILLKMFLHWIIAELVSATAFLVQFSGKIDRDPDSPAAFLYGKTYDLNILFYMLGLAIFLAGYFFAWKLYLAEDWLKLNCKKKRFLISGILMEVIMLGVTFLLFFAAMALSLGWANFSSKYRWVDYSIFVLLLFMVVMPLFFFRKKESAD